MAVLKPRERLVYFRISEDEFHQFVSLCEQEGARSVSDLARSAVQRLIADCNRRREDREIAPMIHVLDKLISEVRSQLEYLAALKTHVGISVSANSSSTTSAVVETFPPKEEQSYGNPA